MGLSTHWSKIWIQAILFHFVLFFCAKALISASFHSSFNVVLLDVKQHAEAAAAAILKEDSPSQ